MEPLASIALADALAAARREGRALDAAAWAGHVTTEVQAYQAQARVAALHDWFGPWAPRHWKSGGPSRDAVLTHAALPPSGVRASPADLTDLAFHAPGVEAEIALRLARDISPAEAAQLSATAAAALVDAMAVSIEIVDSRWRQGTQAPALLRLADAQSHGALALGHWLPWAPRDWSTQRCEARVGSGPLVARIGTHPMSDPAWLLPIWLRHATRDGRTVAAGTVVTTGSWVGVIPAARGDLIRVQFAGIGTAEARI